MSFEFEINFSGLDSILPDVHAFTRQAGEALGKRGQELMREEEPFRTGVLRETTERVLLNVPRGYGEEVVATAFYALFVARGTGIHFEGGGRIFPEKAKALRFSIGGRIVFARSIAGQKANPFHERAFVRLDRERNAMIARVLKEVFG